MAVFSLLSSDIRFPSPDRREIYRYLGYRCAVPDAMVREACDRCIVELEAAIVPAFVWEKFPLSFMGSSPGFPAFAGLIIESRSLARNLRDCEEVILFAATLGLWPDRLIRRAGINKPSDMVILQAAAAAMIEAYCDDIQQHFREQAAAQGLFLRPRFSPGYGDFPLTYQQDLIRLLNTPKAIGVTLTESLLMMPTKSVTALIGISKQGGGCPPQGCEACGKTDCIYRRT